MGFFLRSASITHQQAQTLSNDVENTTPGVDDDDDRRSCLDIVDATLLLDARISVIAVIASAALRASGEALVAARLTKSTTGPTKDMVGRGRMLKRTSRADDDN